MTINNDDNDDLEHSKKEKDNDDLAKEIKEELIKEQVIKDEVIKKIHGETKNGVLSKYTDRLFGYLAMAVITVGIIVMLVFLIQQNQNTAELKENSLDLNHILAKVNQTQITEEQNKFEMTGRANQTKQILNETKDLILNHDKELRTYIDKSNKDNKLVIEGIRAAQKQNDLIIQTQNYISLANNLLIKAGIEKLGLNATEIIEKYTDTHQDNTSKILEKAPILNNTQ